MPKRKWSEAVDRGIAAYRSGAYCYFYGAKNVVLTESTMNALIAAEPAYFARYTAEEIRQIKKNSIGLVGVDCSAFTGLCTGDQQWSKGQIANCSKYNTIQAGPTGSVLFTTWGGRGRHVGLDAGNGMALQAGWESTDRAIREGRAGILFTRISDTAWEQSGESNAVDYTGARSPYEPTSELIREVYGGFETFVGEAYGATTVPVYQDPTGTALLPEWPYLAAGNLYDVIDDGGAFWRVWIAGKYAGWVRKENTLRKTPERTGTVRTALHLRQAPGAQSKSLQVMPAGTVVQICDTKPAPDGRPWYYIINGGVYGFASAYYIK